MLETSIKTANEISLAVIAVSAVIQLLLLDYSASHGDFGGFPAGLQAMAGSPILVSLGAILVATTSWIFLQETMLGKRREAEKQLLVKYAGLTLSAFMIGLLFPYLLASNFLAKVTATINSTIPALRPIGAWKLRTGAWLAEMDAAWRFVLAENLSAFLVVAFVVLAALVLKRRRIK